MSSWSKYQPRWRADLTNNNIQYFLEWRDAMANSPRQADYAWMVLMRLVSWARARGLTTYRPPDRIERALSSTARKRRVTGIAVVGRPGQRQQIALSLSGFERHDERVLQRLGCYVHEGGNVIIEPNLFRTVSLIEPPMPALCEASRQTLRNPIGQDGCGDARFERNSKRISISGYQEEYSADVCPGPPGSGCTPRSL